jgi:hypothetical protein
MCIIGIVVFMFIIIQNEIAKKNEENKKKPSL